MQLSPLCHTLPPLWHPSYQGEEGRNPKYGACVCRGSISDASAAQDWHRACTLTKHKQHLSAHLAQGLLFCNVLHVLLPVKQPEGQRSHEPINFHKIIAAIIVSFNLLVE